MSKGLYVNPTTFVPLNQISEGLTSEIATRQFAAGAYTGFFNYLPDPDPILRKLGMDQTVYKDLLADDQVGPLYNRRKNLTKSLDWDIDQEEAGENEVALCEQALDLLEGNGCSIKDIISQTLNPVGFGYSVFEINWANVNGKWLPVSVWEKPREWFFFDSENQLRFRSNNNYEGIVIRGKDADPSIAIKFILLQNDPSYENPYGDKALSRCFWPVTFKRGGMKFFTTFIEKYGMPYLFGKLPRGAKPEEHADLLSKLMNMVQDAVGTGPDDSSLELIEIKGTQSGDLYEKYLNRCDNSITKAILLNALSTDIQKSGARASSETGAVTIEGDIALTDRDFPVALFNEIFKRIVDLNIGSGKYPEFGVKEVEDVEKDLSERDKNLKDIGVTFTDVYFERKYNLEPDEFEIKEPAPPPNNFPNPNPNFPQDPNSLPLKKGDTVPAGGDVSNPQLSSFKKFFNKLLGKRIELSDAATIKNNIADQISNALPDKLLQFSIEQTLQPVIELAKNSNNREEFINNLAAQFPKMNSNQIEDLAAKVFFIAEIQGRIDAEIK